MNERKIERSDGCCFGWQQLFANSIEIFISHKKSDLWWPKIFEICKALKPCWLLNWVNIARKVARFPQLSLLRLAILLCLLCSLVPSLLFASMKPLILTGVLYLQVYHYPYPFSFAEYVFAEHTLNKHTPKSTQTELWYITWDICQVNKMHRY